MVERVVAAYPNLRVVATTLRTAHTASRNDWGAILWADGETHQARLRPGLEILDRVGGGDSFASGLAYAFLSGLSAAEAVEWGAAHGALAMTTPGDASMATRDEVAAVRGARAEWFASDSGRVGAAGKLARRAAADDRAGYAPRYAFLTSRSPPRAAEVSASTILPVCRM